MKAKVLCGLATVLLLMSGEPVCAQISGATEGQPVVAETGTTATSDAAYFDAYVGTGGSSGGTDICTRISAAWNAVLVNPVSSAVIDARAFTGSWTCNNTSGPFAPASGKVPHGILLLGNVDIAAYMTWVIPTQTEVRGIGTGGPSGSTYPYNTIIHNAGTQSTVLQMGASTGGPYFGIVIDSLTVDCFGVSGCTGIVNDEAEENSSVHGVEIWNAPAVGLHVSAYNASDSTHPAASNSGPYRNIQVGYVAATCACTSAIGIQVDGPGSTISGAATIKVIREFNDITISGGGAAANTCGYGGTNSGIAAGIVIYGVSTTFTNSHIEYVCNGIQIGTSSASLCSSYGGTCDTHAVQVSNISIATLTAGGSAITVGNPSNASPLSADVTIIGVGNGSSASSTLLDNTTTTTLSYAKDPFIGLYALGHCATPSSGCAMPAPVKNTQ